MKPAKNIIVIEDSDNDDVQFLKTIPKASKQKEPKERRGLKRQSSKLDASSIEMKVLREDGDDAIERIISEDLETKVKSKVLKRKIYGQSNVDVNRLFQRKDLKVKVAVAAGKIRVARPPLRTVDLSLDDDDSLDLTGDFSWFEEDDKPIATTVAADIRAAAARTERATKVEAAAPAESLRTATHSIRPSQQPLLSSGRTRQEKEKVINPFGRQQLPRQKIVYGIYDEDDEEENLESFISSLTKKQKVHYPDTPERVSNSLQRPTATNRVQCPLCRAFYPRKEIEGHAADCDGDDESSGAQNEHSIAAAVFRKRKELERKKKNGVMYAGPTNYYADEESVLALDGNGLNSEVTGISWESAGQTRFA